MIADYADFRGLLRIATETKTEMATEGTAPQARKNTEVVGNVWKSVK